MDYEDLWPDEDNKKIVGKPDAIYVSRTESYEVRHFIEQFLANQGKANNEANRRAVLAAVMSYTGKSPILRTTLTAHVLATVRWPATPKP